MWAGHVRRKEGSWIKTIIKEDPLGIRPLGKPRLRWEGRVKKDVKAVETNIQRREIAVDGERWRQICIEG